MRPVARAALVTALGVVGLLSPAPAVAAPPANDNYLSSTTINAPDGSLPTEYRDRVDTSEATTQPDLFDPNREGVPFGGGDPEPTSCPEAPSYGKTVWYDFVPPTDGGVQFGAVGFDAVVAVYTWDRDTSRIVGLVRCSNASPGLEEQAILTVRDDRAYTVQVGGVNGAGGPLDSTFTFFPDRDGDGVLDDQPDECPSQPGIRSSGGCPPVVRSTARFTFDRAGNGLRITTLVVDRVPRGARVEARCRGCGKRVVRRARRPGSMSLRGFVGRTIRAGTPLEVRITKGRDSSGRYRYGAYGRSYVWNVTRTSAGKRVDRCIEPGGKKRVRCP